MLYKIGDFSKLSGLSVKTLRYYDEIDLFKPSEVDLFTNYRYYEEKQLEDLKLINQLKEIGFSLNEIQSYWDCFTEELFLRKRKELLNQIEVTQKQIKELDHLRSNLRGGRIQKQESEKEVIKMKTLLERRNEK